MFLPQFCRPLWPAVLPDHPIGMILKKMGGFGGAERRRPNAGFRTRGRRLPRPVREGGRTLLWIQPVADILLKTIVDLEDLEGKVPGQSRFFSMSFHWRFAKYWYQLDQPTGLRTGMRAPFSAAARSA